MSDTTPKTFTGADGGTYLRGSIVICFYSVADDAHAKQFFAARGYTVKEHLKMLDPQCYVVNVPDGLEEASVLDAQNDFTVRFAELQPWETVAGRS